MKKMRRHVLCEGWTRFSLSDDMESAEKVWLVSNSEHRGFQFPIPMKLPMWNKKVRLVLEEIPEKKEG